MIHHTDLLHIHRWPKAQEITKLHLSLMLLTLGTSLVGIFVPIYLLGLGYTVLEVAFFYLIFQTTSWLCDITSGFMTARFGPKHVMKFSFIFRIGVLVSLYLLPEYSWLFYVLPLFMAIQGMHSLAYFTEFSKLAESKSGKSVKGSEGKQMGRAYVASRIASAVGPLIGGLIITNYSIKVNLIIATMFVIAAGAVLNGHEPVRTHQKTRVRRLKLSTIKPDAWGMAGISFGFIAGGVFYGLFLGEFVLTSGSEYSILGLISTISFAVSIFASMLVGKLSDSGRSWSVVKVAAIGAALTDGLRGFALTTLSTGIVNAPGASLGTARRIPLFKGAYQSVNKLEGFRISYWMKVFSVIGLLRIAFWVIFIGLYQVFETKLAMQIMFIATSVVTLSQLKSRGLYEPSSK